MKVTLTWLFALFLSMTAAWGFVMPSNTAKTAVKAEESSTKLDVYYDGYGGYGGYRPMYADRLNYGPYGYGGYGYGTLIRLFN